MLANNRLLVVSASGDIIVFSLPDYVQIAQTNLVGLSLHHHSKESRVTASCVCTTSEGVEMVVTACEHENRVWAFRWSHP